MVNADENQHDDPVVVATYVTAGEAEVAQAKLRAFGIDSAIDDQIEGGTLFMEDEPGIHVEVRAQEADEARRILAESAPDEPATR